MAAIWRLWPMFETYFDTFETYARLSTLRNDSRLPNAWNAARLNPITEWSLFPKPPIVQARS
jgi:hypothetical protein